MYDNKEAEFVRAKYDVAVAIKKAKSVTYYYSLEECVTFAGDGHRLA